MKKRQINTHAPVDFQKFVAHHGPKKKLSRWPTRIEALYRDGDEYLRYLNTYCGEIADAQERLYAERKWSLLIIFQGMDASGKDGVIKHVFSSVNPQGCHVRSFSRPSEEELSHDFLWRVSPHLPGRGHIGIFNRSYYEEVIVPRVHPEFLEMQGLPAKLKLDKKIWANRLQDISNYEAYLGRQGTKVLKFFLHVGRQEQKERLLSRLDNSKKFWKFDPKDLEARKNWLKYQKAFEECIEKTSSPTSPWYLIPADDKLNARLLVSQIVAKTLRDLNPKWPELSRAKKAELARYRRQLLHT